MDKEKLGKGGGGGPSAEDFESDLQMSASAFEALERDFQEVRFSFTTVFSTVVGFM